MNNSIDKMAEGNSDTKENRTRPALVHFAIISSVREDEFSKDQVSHFGKWLSVQLNTAAATSAGSVVCFDAASTAVSVVGCPVAYADMEAAYDDIAAQHPEVSVIFHILPGSDSREYNMMLKLAEKHGLIRQGILKENALTFFRKVNPDPVEVARNMLKWISRNTDKIYDRMDLVKPVLSYHTTSASESLSTNTVHSKSSEPSAAERSMRQIQVTGFPPSFSKYEVANLLHKFTVKDVEFTMSSANGAGDGRMAVVELGSMWQALQATDDQHLIKCKHQIRVVPVSPLVASEALSSKKAEQAQAVA